MKEYIETGYENELKELLNNKNLNSIFINGKFGEGKSRLLKEVLNDMDKEELELKLYGEYIETNYIDYLYESLKSQKNIFQNSIDSILKNNNILYIFLLLFIPIMPFLYKKTLSNFSVNNNFISFLFLITILILATLYIFSNMLLNELKLVKKRKVNFIKKKIKQYDFIIIDDLDRVYIKNNEVLKMIHFLYEEVEESKKTKLILLGDKEQFIGDDKLDVLEKYYDISFDVAKEQIVEVIIKNIKEFLNSNWFSKIEENNDLSFIEKIWKNLEPRKLLKISKQLKREGYLDTVKALNRNDFLFVLTLYVENKVPMTKFYKIIRGVIGDGFDRYDLYKKATTVDSDFEKKVIELLDDTELNLSKEYKGYLIFEYERYINRKNFAELNRLFYMPKAYIINSSRIDLLKEEEILNQYDDLIKNGELTEYYYYTYSRANSQEEAMLKVLNICECDETLNGKYTDLFKNYFYDGSGYIKNYPNEVFKVIVFNDNGYVSKYTYDRLKKNLSGSYDKLNIGNKFELLYREAFQEGEDYFKNKILPKYKNEIINEMIKTKRIFRFFDIFGQKKIATYGQMIEILDTYLEYMKHLKKEYPHDAERGTAFRSDESDKDLKKYNEFKDLVHSVYGIDVSNYEFSFEKDIDYTN